MALNPDNYDVNPSVKVDDLYSPDVQTGLNTPTESAFYSDRTGFLWGVLGDESKTIEERRAKAQEMIASTPTSQIHQSMTDLAISSTAPLQESFKIDASIGLLKPKPDAQQINDAFQAARSLEDLKQGAQQDPKAGMAEAVVWNLNPSLDETVRNEFALHDYMGGTIAARIEGDSGLKKFGDFLSGTLIPGRFSAGQFQATHFYDTLHTWNTWDAQQRYQNWPRIEADLWKASGDNSMVYQSLVAPFLDPNDEVWNKVDAGIDATAIASYAWSGLRIARVLRGMNKMLDFRELAKATGNGRVLGEQTVGKIAEGDGKAVMEGFGIVPPEGDKHFPELISEAAGPTGSVLTDLNVAAGTAGPSTNPLALQLESALGPEERRGKLIFAASRVLNAGTITDVAEDARGAGVTLTIDKPSFEIKPTVDLIKERTGLRKNLKDLRSRLEAEIAANPPGAASSVAEDLQAQIDTAVGREKILSDALASGKAATKAGVKVKGLKVPSVTKEEIQFNWTVDDVNEIKFNEQKIGPIASALGSKEMTLDRATGQGLTAEGTILDMWQRKIFADYSRFYQEINKWTKTANPFKWGAWNPLNPKNRIQAVLLRGDFEKKVFSESELHAGVDTDLGKIYLNDKEIQGYIGSRVLFDDLWYGLNKMRREAREFAGQKSFAVNYIDKEGAPHKVPVFGYVNDIKHTIPEVGPTNKARKAVYATSGEVVDLEKIPNLERDLANHSKGFVRLSEPFYTSDGHAYKYMLVDVQHTGGLKWVKEAHPIPQQVLPYRKGYVPKIITDPIFHVVETDSPMIINGTELRSTRAIAGFQSKQEAEAYIKLADRAHMSKAGAKAENAPSTFMRTRDLNAEYRKNPYNKDTVDFISDQLFQGAFAGHRTDGVFTVGLAGKEGQRMSAFETMQRYADYVGRYAPMHTFKEARIKQFLDQAKGMLEISSDWTSKLHPGSDLEKYRAAKAMQDWMLSTFAVPTSAENAFHNFTKSLAHMMDSVIFKNEVGDLRIGAKWSKLAQKKLLQSKWARDPWQASRALAFDMYLGMFNPAQLIVQSAGMLTPGMLHPFESAKVMPKFFALRTLHSMQSADDAAKAARMFGQNEKEFKTMFNAYRRSGVADSILNNADFGNYVNHIGGYYSRGFWDTIKKNGRLFYNMGELNNRTFAWVLGYERKMAEKGWSRVKTLSDANVIDITKEGLRLGMNLSSANRAAWQKGPLALPTQFWKVTTQFYENMFSSFMGVKKGAAWTKRESAAAAFNTLLLMGAAGYSIDELWTNYEPWLIQTLGLDPSTPDGQNAIAAARGGLLELASLKIFNTEMDLSDRIGVASGINLIYENTIKPTVGIFFGGEDKDFVKAMLGASYGIKTRMFDAYAKVMGIFNTAIESDTWNSQVAVETAKALIQVPSSGNNAYIAYVWHLTNSIPVKSTGETFGMEPGASVILAKAMGIDPLAIEKFYIIDKQSKEYEQLKLDISKQVVRIARELYNNGQYTDEKARDFAQKQMQVLASGLEGRDREDVIKFALQALDQDPKTDQLIVRMIDGIMNSEEQGDVSQRDVTNMRILQNLTTGKDNSAK